MIEGIKDIIGIKEVRAGTILIWKKSTGSVIQPETITYMDRIGLSNDSTSTIYGKTGAEIWALFNDCIMIAKNAGVLNNIYSWHPMFGNTVDTVRVNALGSWTLIKTIEGDWTFSALGNQGNGSNTYMSSENFVPDEDLDPDDAAFTIACNSNFTVGSSQDTLELGCSGGGNASFLQLKQYNTAFRAGMNGTERISTPVSTAEGISTVSRFEGVLKTFRNQVNIETMNVAPALMPNQPIAYGCYRNGAQLIFHSSQRLLSECISRGDDATVQVVQQMIDTWEAGLGRKTW